MSATSADSATRPDVNIVVCTDEYGCARWYHRGRNANAILRELNDAAGADDAARVQITTASCIMGCTYGPRFDVARRWSGEKALYGSICGEATVTRRGRVNFVPIPDDLAQVIGDHLPESASPLASLHAIRRLEFIHRTLGNGMPSYAIWMGDDQQETVYRIYLRRSEDAAANPVRHRLFMALMDKYGSTVTF